VLSLPAIRAVRSAFPQAEIAVLARPWVADLYARESAIQRVIPYTAAPGWRGWPSQRAFAAQLREERFDCAILLQNAFEAALLVWMAGIPRRIGYRRDGRGLLLTDAVPAPEPGEIPRHERFYYLELIRRAGLIERFPTCESVRLEGSEAARAAGCRRFREAGVALPVVGVSPGAAYGGAKRWPAERFAEAAVQVARTRGASIAVFGSSAERPLCDAATAAARAAGAAAHNFAGGTSLSAFLEMAAACRVFLTNDSGAMHIASAAGAPTVAVFGATDDVATGPTGPLARVVREPVACSPCLLRECPIDHRCMTGVTAGRVAREAGELWEASAVGYAQ
jgi:heptosyltransferase-2